MEFHDSGVFAPFFSSVKQTDDQPARSKIVNNYCHQDVLSMCRIFLSKSYDRSHSEKLVNFIFNEETSN